MHDIRSRLQLFKAAAALVLFAAAASQGAASAESGRSEGGARPPVASSFIGMGTATGTPSGDVRAAIQPQLHTLGVPHAVSAVPVDPKDLFSLPTPMELRRPLRIGIQASLGESQYAPWLAYTAAQLRHAIGQNFVRILWLDDSSLMLGVQSRQLDFVVSDPDTVLRAQRGDAMETLASFKPVEAGRAEDSQAGVVFMKRTGAGPAPEKAPLKLPLMQSAAKPLRRFRMKGWPAGSRQRQCSCGMTSKWSSCCETSPFTVRGQKRFLMLCSQGKSASAFCRAAFLKGSKRTGGCPSRAIL